MEEEKKKVRKIVMSINRETLTFLIIDRSVYYSDKHFKALIRIIPKPTNLIATIAKSRNRIPMFIAGLFNLNKEEIEEYNNAKTVDELANIIIKDGKKNSCLLIANADMEVDSSLIENIKRLEVVV